MFYYYVDIYWGKNRPKCKNVVFIILMKQNMLQNVTHHLKIMHKEATLKNDMLEPT